MRRPFNGTPNITTFYGTIQEGTRRGYHTGVDYALNVGTPVLAPIAGTVIRNGDGTAATDGRGWYVVFKGEDGIFHQLFHLSRRGVANGYVNEGDILGYSGNTGFSTGPHLHWETTTRDDRTSDFAPADWLFKNTVPETVPAPVTYDHEYVGITGDYRTTYETPRGKKTGRIFPNQFGGTLTYQVLAHDGDYIQIERQDGSGKQWLYAGTDVASLTNFYHA